VAIRELEWLSRRIVEYHSSMDDVMGVVEDLDELGKLGRGFSSMDDLENVDIAAAVVPRPTYVSAHLNMSQKQEITEWLNMYTCCFAGSSSNISYQLKSVLDHINRKPGTSSQRSSGG
jgi:hypothetical protein